MWPALGAGCAAGVVFAVLQVFLTTPLILHAEHYEASFGGPQYAQVVPSVLKSDFVGGAQLWLVHGDAETMQAWAPEDGLERMAYTALTAVLLGVGYGLLLVSAMALKGDAISPRAGLAWGLAGFVSFVLAPAMGLPPELPGSAAADLLSRQVWWAGTAIATAVGIAGLVFARNRLWVAASVVLIAIPHIIGAPEAGGYVSDAPAELAAEFASVSLGASLVFWAVLGSVAALLWTRGEPDGSSVGA